MVYFADQLYVGQGFAAPFYTGSLGELLGYTLVLIIISNIIAYNLYGTLLKKYTITFLTFAGFVCPVFGAGFGWLFFGEVITWHYGLALALIMVGLYLFHQEEVERGNKKLLP